MNGRGQFNLHHIDHSCTSQYGTRDVLFLSMEMIGGTS